MLNFAMASAMPQSCFFSMLGCTSSTHLAITGASASSNFASALLCKRRVALCWSIRAGVCSGALTNPASPTGVGDCSKSACHCEPSCELALGGAAMPFSAVSRCFVSLTQETKAL